MVHFAGLEVSVKATAALLKLSQWFASRSWRDQPVSEQSALLMAPIETVAPTAIGRRDKKVKKAADGFAQLTLEWRHEFRISVKKIALHDRGFQGPVRSSEGCGIHPTAQTPAGRSRLHKRRQSGERAIGRSANIKCGHCSRRTLRHKLAQATGGRHHIETVWGRGYVLRDWPNRVRGPPTPEEP